MKQDPRAAVTAADSAQSDTQVLDPPQPLPAPDEETRSVAAAPKARQSWFMRHIGYSAIHWFDSWAGEVDEKDKDSRRIDWVRCAPFLSIHFVGIAVIWVGWSPVAAAVAVFLYALRVFALTGFYHRYFSHRTFKTSRPAQFIFAVIGNMAAQRGPLWWAAHHRHHHKHSDQEEDLHSPHREGGFIYSHMLWIMTPKNFPTNLKMIKDFARFPELVFLDRFDTLVPLTLGVSLFSLGWGMNSLWPELGTSGMQMLIWGFFISTIAVFHVTCMINSLTHMFGRKRYKTGDHSRNSLILALLTFGEGWHNNHHHYPASTRQGFYWWEIDITYYLLKILSWMGIVWDLKPVPVGELETDRIDA